MLFFFPIVFGTFFQQIHNTADTIVVGRFVGKEALAAVGGSVNQVVNLIVEVFVGLTSGAAVIVSQFYGAKDKKNLDKTIHTAFAFSAAAGIVIGIIGYLASDWILTAMNTPLELMDESRVYLHIYFFGTLFNLIYNMGASILRAMGDSRRPLYVLIIACTLNIFLDILLVVIGGMGVEGVAFATIFCQGISAVIVTMMLIKGQEEFSFKLKKLRFYGNSLRSVLSDRRTCRLRGGNVLCGKYCDPGICKSSWNRPCGCLGNFWQNRRGFLDGCQCFFHIYYYFRGGRITVREKQRGCESVLVCLGMSYAAAVVLSAVLVIFAEPLYRLFTTDKGVVEIGVYMMRFLMPSYFLYVAIGILSGALRGAGKVLVPVLLTCGGVCILRITWMFAVLPVFPGIETIMLSYPVSWGITAILFVIYYIKRFPRVKETVHTTEKGRD